MKTAMPAITMETYANRKGGSQWKTYAQRNKDTLCNQRKYRPSLEKTLCVQRGSIMEKVNRGKLHIQNLFFPSIWLDGQAPQHMALPLQKAPLKDSI